MNMKEVEIRFDDGREGIIPVGTYLNDAAKRMGAASFECEEIGGHECQVEINEGAELLSEPLAAEREILSKDELDRGVRLACYTKIEKPGVITAMVVKKKKDEKSKSEEEADREEAYRKEFAELPLEKKIAHLAQLEVIALGETFAFVVNSPFKVFEKIGDVMAEFGFKKEEEEKKKTRPVENKANGSSGAENATGEKQKS